MLELYEVYIFYMSYSQDYIPERFEHERMKHMDSHAFIPFAAGPR